MTTPKENHQRVWRSLVSEYATRELTYSSDKLPALAGLASYLKVSYSVITATFCLTNKHSKFSIQGLTSTAFGSHHSRKIFLDLSGPFEFYRPSAGKPFLVLGVLC